MYVCTMINNTDTHVRKYQFQLSFVHYETEKISQLKNDLKPIPVIPVQRSLSIGFNFP